MLHLPYDATAVMHTSLHRHCLHQTKTQTQTPDTREPQTLGESLPSAQTVHLLPSLTYFSPPQQISSSVHVKRSLWCNNPQPFTSLHNPVCINSKAPRRCFSVLSFNPIRQYARHVISIRGRLTQPNTGHSVNTSTQPTNNPKTHSWHDPGRRTVWQRGGISCHSEGTFYTAGRSLRCDLSPALGTASKDDLLCQYWESCFTHDCLTCAFCLVFVYFFSFCLHHYYHYLQAT